MATVQINARVDPALKKAIDKYCRSRGIVLNHFVQEALIDRLEELEDIEDLKKIRHEPTRPLAEVLAELDLDGTMAWQLGPLDDGFRNMMTHVINTSRIFNGLACCGVARRLCEDVGVPHGRESRFLNPQ